MKKLHRHLESRYEWYSEWHKHPKHQALHYLVLVAFILVSVAIVQNNVSTRTNTSFAATVEVYPGPGVDTYKSNLYTVEVYDGTVWKPSYTYKYSRLSEKAWARGTYPSVNFTTFGTNGPTQVRISKINSSISTIQISPKSKNITSSISSGKATFTLNPNNKTWITINGDDANPLFIFADEPKPAVPVGAKYFGPGVWNIAPTTDNQYKAVSNQVIYLDGGAWVRGRIDIRGTTNVQIIGPGVLSGELWTNEFVRTLPTYEEQRQYIMVLADFNKPNTHRLKGITILASPYYNIYGLSEVTSAKLFSPWNSVTDGFVNSNTIDQVFAFVGDNVIHLEVAGVNDEDVILRNSFVANTNNGVIMGGRWYNKYDCAYNGVVDNVDIRKYTPSTVGNDTIFQVWQEGPDNSGGACNQTYQNIRIEGNIAGRLLQMVNITNPWDNNAYNPPLGDGYNFVLKNITLTGTQGIRSEIKGWDANNMFRNVTLDNVKINGTVVTQANLSNYFDVNSYVSGLVVTAPFLDTTAPTVSITSPLSGSTVSGTVNITASASDNVGVTSVEFRRGTTVLGTDTSSPYAYSWNTTTVANGIYSLTAVARDAYGNTKTSTAVSVTVSNTTVSPTPTPPTTTDTTPPTVNIIYPLNNGTVTRSSTITIEATASDTSGISKVEFYIKGVLKCTETLTPYTCVWKVPKNRNVIYAIQAKAYDKAGNTNTSNISVTGK